MFTKDLEVLVASWQKKAGDPGLNPCADFDHKAEGAYKYRVFTKDLGILSTNWKKKDSDLPGNCASCERGQELRGGEPTSKGLVGWLAEIWLDPEVQKAIDEDAWRRLVESLEKDWDAGI